MSEKNDDTKQIIIQKLYIKDSSFESPNTPEVFKGAEWKPKTEEGIIYFYNQLLLKFYCALG